MKTISLQKGFAYLLSALLFTSISSCSNPVQDELLNYINVELPKIAQKETDAVNLYESVTGDNYTDDNTLYNALKDQVVPQYRDFTTELESLSANIKTDEVRKIHESYIEACNLQLSAFTTMIAAIENQDYKIISEANDKLAKARSLIRDWKNNLDKLCSDNGVEIKN